MIFQVFRDLGDVNATSDLSELLIYVNEITGNIAMPGVLFSFFLIAFIGGYLYDLRYGRDRIPANFTAAAFVTFGLAVLMSMKTGLLNPVYLVLSIGMAVLGVVWLYLTSET